MLVFNDALVTSPAEQRLQLIKIVKWPYSFKTLVLLEALPSKVEEIVITYLTYLKGLE